MFATDFHGLARIVNLVEEVTLSRTEGLGCLGGRGLRGDFALAGKKIVHRGCTGNAERQWSVASGQWPIPRFAWRDSRGGCPHM